MIILTSIQYSSSISTPINSETSELTTSTLSLVACALYNGIVLVRDLKSDSRSLPNR